MSHFILPDTAGEALRSVLADIDAALRYMPVEGIGKEHVSRWRDNVNEVLGQMSTPPSRGPRPRRLRSAPGPDA